MVTQRTKHYLEFSESEVESELTVVSNITISIFPVSCIVIIIYKVMVLFQTGEVLMSDIDPE